MARRQDVQSADGIVAMVNSGGLNVLIASAPGVPGTYNATTGVPVNGIPGYAKSCLFINTLGTTGSALYYNSGDATSATWTLLV